MADEVKKTAVKPRKKNTSGVAEEGSVVKIHYTGKLDDGNVFDSSDGKEPIEFTVGQHMVIPGFEKAVLGMKVGDKKSIKIPPEDAYGHPDDKLTQKVPMEAFGDMKPEEGMMLALNHPQAPQPIPAKVLKIEDDGATLDMNHPLAGQTLNFEIELVEVR